MAECVRASRDCEGSLRRIGLVVGSSPVGHSILIFPKFVIFINLVIEIVVALD